MCLTTQTRSTAPCGHTYFHLVRPCSTSTNLTNCSRLSLSGWEQRTDACAFCAGAVALDPAHYRLLGYEPCFYDSAAGAAQGGDESLSRTNSLSTMTTSSQASARRDSRRGSVTRSETSSMSGGAGGGGAAAIAPPPAHTATPLMQMASEKNMQRKQRIDSYLADLPDTVLRAGGQGFAEQDAGGDSASASDNRRASSLSSASGSRTIDAVRRNVAKGKRWSLRGSRRLSKIF